MKRRASDILRMVIAAGLMAVAALLVLLSSPFALAAAGIGWLATWAVDAGLSLLPVVAPAEGLTEADNPEPIEPSAFWSRWGIRRATNL